MAKATGNPKVGVELKITFEVNEAEARALEALSSYGDDAAVEAFYKHCGSHYMKPYEAGFRAFLKEIRRIVAPGIAETDCLRKAVEEAKKQK